MKANKGIRFLIIRALHLMTAYAMEVSFKPGKPALKAYAAFTRDALERIPETDLWKVQMRMYRTSLRMGRILRRLLFVRTDEKARRVVFGLYRCIGIRLEGDCPGRVIVSRCYFSRFYTPRMCRMMSAMDKGIFAGLFGGGKLEFESRITEGCPCCQARFSHERKEV